VTSTNNQIAEIGKPNAVPFDLIKPYFEDAMDLPKSEDSGNYGKISHGIVNALNQATTVHELEYAGLCFIRSITLMRNKIEANTARREYREALQ